MFYLSGNQVNRAADDYRREGKADAKDAAIIADQVRVRRDLTSPRVDGALIEELRLLVARRRDLAGDRIPLANRLYDQLLGISPALERVLDLTSKGQLIEGRFHRHRHAVVLLGIPGIGVLLGAEFLAATAGDMTAVTSADPWPQHRAIPAGSAATCTTPAAATAA